MLEVWDPATFDVALHTEMVGRQVWVKRARFRQGRIVDGLYYIP